MSLAAFFRSAPLASTLFGARAAQRARVTAAATAGGVVLMIGLTIHLAGDPRVAAGAVSAPVIPATYADAEANEASDNAEHDAQADTANASIAIAGVNDTPSHIAALTQPGPGGLLPALGPDNRSAAIAYARDFSPQTDRPHVGVIVTGLGLSQRQTDQALATLPPSVTLGVSPYASNLQDLIDRARNDGFEVVLEAPTEPFDYPANDLGPHTLLTSVSRRENARRLDWVMARATGYFGVLMCQGDKFISDPATVPVARTLRGRGVALIACGDVPAGSHNEAFGADNAPFAQVFARLNGAPAPTLINQTLLRAEAAALRDGAGLAVLPISQLTSEHIAEWTVSAEAAGYVVAPASTIATLQHAARTDAGETALPNAPA